MTLQQLIAEKEVEFEKIGEGRVRFIATRQEVREFLRQFATDIAREAFRVTKVEREDDERELTEDDFDSDGERLGYDEASWNAALSKVEARQQEFINEQPQ